MTITMLLIIFLLSLSALVIGCLAYVKKGSRYLETSPLTQQACGHQPAGSNLGCFHRYLCQSSIEPWDYPEPNPNAPCLGGAEKLHPPAPSVDCALSGKCLECCGENNCDNFSSGEGGCNALVRF